MLFDLFAIATGMKFWKRLLCMMFDTSLKYWNCIWVFFVLLGGFVFGLGIRLLTKEKCLQI